jgi:DNA-binding transcriptional LysR family regulator
MRLEEELGVRLLQRTTRKLSLTAVGRTYFDQVRGALALMERPIAVTPKFGTQNCSVTSLSLRAAPGPLNHPARNLVLLEFPVCADMQESCPA